MTIIQSVEQQADTPGRSFGWDYPVGIFGARCLVGTRCSRLSAQAGRNKASKMRSVGEALVMSDIWLKPTENRYAEPRSWRMEQAE